METFQFELVSPEKILVNTKVTQVVVPGEEGQFGVLAGHAPLISGVQPGVIDIYADDENSISERIFVNGGFAEVTRDRLTVLAEEAIKVSEIDAAQLDRDIEKLSNEIEQSSLTDEKLHLEIKLSSLLAKRAAVEGRSAS